MLLMLEKRMQHKPHRLTDAQSPASYRTIRLVTNIMVYGHGDIYPVCPRCRNALDREYMRFCSNCGQRLGWSIYHPENKYLPGRRNVYK